MEKYNKSRKSWQNKSSGRKFDSNKKNERNFNVNNKYNNIREMHKAICSECGKECEVPFKPTEGKSVYCRECYRNKKQF